jgi:hypothetical protein
MRSNLSGGGKLVADQPRRKLRNSHNPSGKCFRDTNMVFAERKGDDGYLVHPGSKTVYCLFVGWETIDFKLVMRKLRRLFGIRTIRIDEAGK